MFVELICQSHFSFRSGASSPQELIAHAQQIGLAALALTDLHGVYGLPRAHAASQDHNFKLICGSTLHICSQEGQHPHRLILLAQNKQGYSLMCQMLTQAHKRRLEHRASSSLTEQAPFITRAELRSFLDDSRRHGLVALCKNANTLDLLKDYLAHHTYIPLSRFKDGHDTQRTHTALELSQGKGIPIVASNDVRYHSPNRRPLHDVLTCIRHKTSLMDAGFRLKVNAERYLKSPFEMRLLFEDMPQAVTRTLEVADQCTFSLAELRYRYPSEWIPQGHSAQSYLDMLTRQGAHKRYPQGVPDKVWGQIDHELALIQQLTFADYFLTLYDIVDFAQKRRILCQGRGSAANSVVCYCLGITAIDPVRMDLLFERFLSVERGEPPDIDVDFEHERREEVIQYIYEKYGRHRAAMVSAVITYQKRSMLRDLAKVFGIDVGTRSSKSLLQDWPQLLAHSPVPKADEHIQALSQELEGFPRHLSIHSGGFTLSADPITDCVPVEPARMPGRSIIQWDKNDLALLGLLKVDILALGMLSALRKTLDHVGLRFHEIPQEDAATYRMIQSADTVGVFQIESRAQMNMSGRLLPKNFYDLVIQVAIVRPGPIIGQMVHPYLKRRRGLEKPQYPHPKLKAILGRTLGIPLFQEQLMKIAIDLGQFTGGEADRLRRAIGAWRSSGDIRRVADTLLERLLKQGIPHSYALELLEHMKGFAHYGFPESHAASFALITYVSCYLKRHHPAAFTCALLNSQPMGFYAPHSLIDEARRHGIQILPIDIQSSAWNSSVEQQGQALRLGLRMLKGLSFKDAEQLIQHRPYTSLEDVVARTHLRRDLLEGLALAEAFSSFGLSARESLWRILASHTSSRSAQGDLFAGLSSPTRSYIRPTSDLERLSHHYQALKASHEAHPMQALRRSHPLPRLTTQACKDLPHKSWVKTSGLVLIQQRPPTANGVCFSALEDEYGILDLVFFQNTYARYKATLAQHRFVQVRGVLERDARTVSLIVRSLRPAFSLPSSSKYATPQSKAGL